VSIPEDVVEETDRDLIEIESTKSKKSSSVSSADLGEVRSKKVSAASGAKTSAQKKDDKENQDEEGGSSQHPDTENDSPQTAQTKL
jgi:hypothetical protein